MSLYSNELCFVNITNHVRRVSSEFLPDNAVTYECSNLLQIWMKRLTVVDSWLPQRHKCQAGANKATDG